MDGQIHEHWHPHLLSDSLSGAARHHGHARLPVHCLVSGEIVAAYAEPDFIRATEIDDQELIHDSPLMAYLAPGRFATIDRSNGFPFPADMKK